MDSYDNDFLFIDDDLFLLLIPVECINNDPAYTMIFIEDVEDGMD
jgi:hypothetical protein